MSMKPTGNANLDRLSPSERESVERLIESIAKAKQQDEADNEPEAQTDDSGRKTRDPSWATQEFPHRRFFHSRAGTYENPIRLTAEEVARMDELSENPRASTMGRTRRNRL